jgi:pyridoxal phosphate enzyme (YggS family)
MNTLREMDSITTTLQGACEAVGATLVAVVKGQPNARILAAYNLGIRNFAQSYIQEALRCQDELSDEMPDARWHFIGRIQSNKTKHLEKGWLRVHSVDRLRIAKRLGCAEALIQVRLGGEHSKAGVNPLDLAHFLEELKGQTELRVRGLMALPPPQHQWGKNNYFAELRQLREAMTRLGLLDSEGAELSMGTSADYPLALSTGATWIRVGSALLGPRLTR